MSTFNGDKIKIEIFGQSHSNQIGVNCFGFPKMKIDKVLLKEFMDRRKPSKDNFSTKRVEDDLVVFTDGVEENGITGGCFSAIIQNTNQKSKDYNCIYAKPRPSHADYTSFVKTGNLDFSGGGKFSGRMTAPLCIAGGISKQYLNSLNVHVYSYMSSIGEVEAVSYKNQEITKSMLNKINGKPFLFGEREMLEEIEKARKTGDSVGGVVECVVFGLKAGVGDAIFDGIESKVASLIYSIPAVKGVEFGGGFSLSKMQGSIANDELFYTENKEVETYTNNNGGITGGISNGMPLLIRVAFKPTPSISKKQRTIDLVNKTNTTIKIEGRHDSCVAVRGRVAVESAVCLALMDLILKEGY